MIVLTGAGKEATCALDGRARSYKARVGGKLGDDGDAIGSATSSDE
jgi:hypothetical protein